ncbi:Protein diaphanous 1 [Sticta canariensis]|nr:Protein diaphanous 1 [Sticta canariensis]
MVYYFLLQILTTFLVSYLSDNYMPFSLHDFVEYGRLTYNRPPPPPPQVYYPTSVEFAGEFYLRSLSNLTFTVPPSLLFNGTEPCGNTVDQNAFFSSSASLPRFFSEMFHALTQKGSWIAAAAVEILIGFLEVLTALGPVAATAWTLREQWKQDKRDLETRSLSYLVPLWGLLCTIDNQQQIIANLGARLGRSKMDHNALAQLVQDLQAREAESGDTIRQLEITIERQTGQITGREAEIHALEADSRAKSTSHEAEIADCKVTLEATITEANERFQKAQQTADARIQELEASLEAQKQSSDAATEKLNGDVKTAKEHIEKLLATIQSNSRELQFHRDRARLAQRQHQAGPSGYPPPAPMGMQVPPPPPPPQTPFSHGQSPYAPRPSQIPLPPNRTSGFMGSTPPPGWGRGAGTGGGGPM